jgi:DNA gyrase/topoisomerase IV subunit A
MSEKYFLSKLHRYHKADMIKRTADLVNDKKFEGMQNIRDESDRKWYAYRLSFSVMLHQT